MAESHVLGFDFTSARMSFIKGSIVPPNAIYLKLPARKYFNVCLMVLLIESSEDRRAGRGLRLPLAG